MNGSRIPYQAHTDAVLERELNALSRIYARAVQRYQETKKAAGVPSTNGDDAKERPKNDSHTKSIVPD